MRVSSIFISIIIFCNVLFAQESFTYEGDGFKLDFPGEPEKLDTVIDDIEQHRLSYSNEQIEFVISYLNVPSSVLYETSELGDGSGIGFLKFALNKFHMLNTVVRAEQISLGDYPGAYFKSYKNDLYWSSKAYLVNKKRYYHLYIVHRDSFPASEVTKSFFTSFTLTEDNTNQGNSQEEATSKNNAEAQKQVKIYYDKNFNVVEKNESYGYYSVHKQPEPYFPPLDVNVLFYYASGQLYYKGAFSWSKTENIDRIREMQIGEGYDTSYAHNYLEDGPWEYYYENGQLKAKGHYNNGKRVGEWKYYDKNGRKKRTVYFDENWKKVSSEYKYPYYRVVTKKGERWNVKDFYASGILRKSSKDGFSLGSKQIVSARSGNLQMNGWYSDEDLNTQVGESQFYHDNGVLEMTGQYKNGYKHGKWKHYDEEGNLEKVGSYRNGYAEGEWKFFYSDGNLKSSGYFKNGYKTGVWKTYHYNGSLKMKGRYKDGKPHGMFEYRDYRRYGKILGNWENGKQQGEWKYYNSKGDLIETGRYKNGERNGTWKYYNYKGDLTQTNRYKNGKLVEKTYH